MSLHPLKQNLDALVTDEQRRQFTAIFAQYLKLYPQLELWYDGARIDPSTAIADAVSLVLPPIVGRDRTIRDVKLDIVEWSTPIDSRKIHFCGDNGIVLGSQPARINAPDFAFSIYATSSFFVELAADNLLELELTDGDFARVVEAVRDQSQAHFRRRGHERAGRLIEELKAAGAYPYEGDPTDTLQQRERDVFDMATYAVSNYSKEFRKADTGLKRMTLTLLREALRHNPDSLTQILHAVVGLPKERQNQFSALLKKTELSNIIAASSLIADRIAFLQTLRQAVFDTDGKKVIRERGGLDLLVRDNTWIFGEQFHLAVPEAGLTKVMQRVSEDLGGKRAGGRVTKPDGRTGRVDQLLGRSIPGPHQERREYLIVELKRPSAKADRKMLNQISDYALALAGAPDFRHTDTRVLTYDWRFQPAGSSFPTAPPRLRARSALVERDGLRPRGAELGPGFAEHLDRRAEEQEGDDAADEDVGPARVEPGHSARRDQHAGVGDDVVARALEGARQVHVAVPEPVEHCEAGQVRDQGDRAEHAHGLGGRGDVAHQLADHFHKDPDSEGGDDCGLHERRSGAPAQAALQGVEA